MSASRGSVADPHPSFAPAGAAGRAFVVVGAALAAGTAVAAAAVGHIGIGQADAPGLLLAGAMASLGVGAGILGVTGARPVTDRPTRVAVGILAVGLLCLAASSLVAATFSTDPLESRVVVVTLVVGLGATAVGAVATALAFARKAVRFGR